MPATTGIGLVEDGITEAINGVINHPDDVICGNLGLKGGWQEKRKRQTAPTVRSGEGCCSL